MFSYHELCFHTGPVPSHHIVGGQGHLRQEGDVQGHGLTQGHGQGHQTAEEGRAGQGVQLHQAFCE